MKKLSHENVVQLHEVIDDESSDQLFLVLDYVENGVLLSWDDDSSRFTAQRGDMPDPVTGAMLFSEERAAAIITDILHGLEYLHLHQIAHRDLKPDNILLDSKGSAKIADFGVAHYFEEEAHKEARSTRELSRSQSRGQVSRTEGTYSFWAPEMCEGGTFSAYATDVWAVGVCAFAMVFGLLPYSGDDGVASLFESIKRDELKFPGPLSPEGQDFLRGLLTKDQAARTSLGDALAHPWLHRAPKKSYVLQVPS